MIHVDFPTLIYILGAFYFARIVFAIVDYVEGCL